MNARTLITVFVLTLAGPAAAAGQELRATVIEPAPIYLLPDATRTPLATLPVSTELIVLAQEGEWLRVAYQDRQFGKRVGYVSARKVRIQRVAPPVTLSEPEGTTSPPSRTAPQRSFRRSRVGGKLYGTFGSTAFAAHDTFEAVAGSATHTNFGIGMIATNLWRDLFVDVGWSQTKMDGQRVFVDDGTVYKLGIPLDIIVRPLDTAAGWRLTFGRFSPYGGGGVTAMWYRETSAFAESQDNVRETKFGPLALGGVDVMIVRSVFVGAEVRYRAVKGILGHGGASQAFGEDQAGGFSAALRVSFGK